MSAVGQPLPAAVGPALRVATAAARAVVRTVTYSALFQAPLTLERLHRTLMDVRLDPDALAETLADPWVRERVEVSGGLVHPRGRAEWYHWLLIVSIPIVFWSAILALAVRCSMGAADVTLN